jgi:hypothetical protein
MGEQDKTPNQVLTFGRKTFNLLPPRPDLEGPIRRHKETRELEASATDMWTKDRDIVSDLQKSHLSYWEVLQGSRGLGEIMRIALNSLAGQDVVDLGAGAKPEAFREFLKPYGPSSYLAVDIHAGGGKEPIEEIKDFGEIVSSEYDETFSLSSAVVKGDMLEAASRLPDRSVNVMLSGIDKLIIPPQTDYGAALLTEIDRITRPGGLVFGMTENGGLLPALSQTGAFETYPIHLPVEPGSNLELAFYFLLKRA